MASIDKIVQNIEKFVPQSSNRFELRVDIPGVNGTQTNVDLGNLVLPVIGFETPQKEIVTKNYSYYGIDRKIPYKRQFGDLSVTFMADESGIIQTMLESWMDKLVNPFTDTINTIQSSGAVYLKGKVILTEISRSKDAPIENSPQYIFYEAFPKSILPMSFNSGSNNEALSITAIFSFKQYEYISGAYKTNPSGGIQI